MQETLYGERNDFNSYRIYTHINVYAICKLFIKRKLSQPFQTHIHWVTNESTKNVLQFVRHLHNVWNPEARCGRGS